MLFKKKETDEEISERLLKLTDQKDYGLCAPPMNAQVALNELCDFFLGKDWYVVISESQEQVNTEIVYTIECKLKKHKAKQEGGTILKDSEEFKNNMCEHRCLLKSELQELQENSIPKKKIEDKKQWIEENILENDYASDLDKDIAEYQVNVLQDLLEDK